MEPFQFDARDAERTHRDRVGRYYILGSFAFGVSFMAMCVVIMLAI
jgi:hypothetical protein